MAILDSIPVGIYFLVLLLAVLPLCITEVRRVIHFCDNCRIILRCWRLLIVFVLIF